MKNTKSEMKNTLDGINGRINIEEENLTAQQKKLAKMKPKKEKENASVSCDTISSGLVNM